MAKDGCGHGNMEIESDWSRYILVLTFWKRILHDTKQVIAGLRS